MCDVSWRSHLVRSAVWLLVGHDALAPEDEDDELDPLELVEGSLLEQAKSKAVSATARATSVRTRRLFITHEHSNGWATTARAKGAPGVGPRRRAGRSRAGRP